MVVKDEAVKAASKDVDELNWNQDVCNSTDNIKHKDTISKKIQELFKL